mgnify:CR=1 FL=1
MKTFLRKHGVKIFFLGLFAVLILGYGNYFIHKGFGIGCTPDPPPVEVVVDSWTKPLQESGYKPITETKPANIPGDKLPPSVTPVLVADGTVQDSVEVSAVVVESPDGEHWIDIIVGGEHVEIEHVSWADSPVVVKDNDWSLLVEAAWVDGCDMGLGVAWEPLEVAGSRIGLQTTFDLNADLSDSPDWAAPALRVSRRYGAFSLGAGIGYRIGEGAGLHCGVDVGIAVGI